MLTNITRSSSGNYTCNVQDDRNNTVSSTVTITVQCKSVQEWNGSREEDIVAKFPVSLSRPLLSLVAAFSIQQVMKVGGRCEKLRNRKKKGLKIDKGDEK